MPENFIFPFLVFRRPGGGYRRVRVIFVGSEEVRSGPDAFGFVWSEPSMDGSGNLTAECRAALIGAVKSLVLGTEDTVLVCFSRREWVSVEGPGGLIWNHAEPTWLSHGAELEEHWGRLSMEESEERSNGGWGREFPFIVVKGGAPVCGFNQVEIFQVPPETPRTPGTFTVIYPGESTDETGRLTAGCRAALIEAVKIAVRETGHRRCVVFGPDDCSYIELDGSVVHTTPGWRGRGTTRQQVEDAVVVESLLVH